ncbi:MAG: thiolase family protein [Burkholderiales bacterium]|nr:thiolase family protein [Burkholderiales bacterium]
MDVYVMGVAIHPAADAVRNLRLEEMAYATARAALDDAGISRDEIDHVTLAASDEIDARGITSMLLAAPSGAYLKDEMRVTDSGLAGLHLGAMRAGSGDLQLGLVVSWNQSSIGPLEDIARMRGEPFFLRPIGLNFAIADGLYAGAVAARHGIGEAEVAERVRTRLQSAASNPRAVRREVPSAAEIAQSPRIAHPLRSGHRAPVTDGAVAMVLASGDWLRAHPGKRPLARIAGASWTVDRYQLDGDRLADTAVFDAALQDVLGRAGAGGIDDLDLVELEAQSGWVDVALTKAIGAGNRVAVSPSGGAWAQNPYFCTGLINAAEAALQVSGRAGPHQVKGAKRALAHGSSGFAQQTHGFVIMEGVPA